MRREKEKLSFCRLLLSGAGLFSFALLLSGCHKPPPRPVVWIDIDRAVSARPEWQVLASFDEQARQVKMSASPAPSWAGAEIKLPPITFPKEAQASLEKRRSQAAEAIEDQRSAIENRIIALAKEKADAHKRDLTAKYNADLVTLRKQLQAALEIQARAIVDRYAKLRYPLLVDKANLELKKEPAASALKVKEQIALIDQKLADYDRQADAEVQTLRAQNRESMAASRQQIAQKVNEAHDAELASEVENIKKQMQTAAVFNTKLPTIQTVGARMVGEKAVQIPPFKAHQDYLKAVSALQANLTQSKTSWNDFLHRQTQESAQDWCRRHGYLFSFSREGAKDMTDQFIKEWKP